LSTNSSFLALDSDDSDMKDAWMEIDQNSADQLGIRIRSMSVSSIRSFACLLLLCSVSPAFAELPSMKLQTAALVSPATAWATFGSATSHTPGVAATAVAPEIVELANAFSQNGACTDNCFASRAYQYVRNNVVTEFRFGLGKGGRGALVDQSGTPFDQAQLFANLLRQVGIIPSYQLGTISLTAAQFQSWTGITLAPVACQFLADGGIPALVNGASSCGSIAANAPVSTVLMGHIWVTALSATYDPSYKINVIKQNVGAAALNSAIGCSTNCVSSLTTYVPAPVASDVSGVNQISGVNQPGIETRLNTYAQSLQHYIQLQNTSNRLTTNPNMQVEDLIGGLVIDTNQAVVTGSQLPSGAYSAAGLPWSGEIPDQFRTTLTVQFGPTGAPVINRLLYVDEIGGSRLRLYNASTSPTPTTTTLTTGLYSEQTLLAGGSIPNQGFGLVPLALTIKHPYANTTGGNYLTEMLTFDTAPVINACQAPPVPSGCQTAAWGVNTITILVGLGDANESTVAHYSALVQRDVTHTAEQTLSAWDPTLTSAMQVYPCTSATQLGAGPHQNFGCYETHQAVTGASWLAQSSRAAHLAAGVNTSALQQHHSIGIITSGIYMHGALLFSVQSSLSANSLVANPDDRQGTFFGAAAVFSRLEGSVSEQQGSTLEGGSAISMLTRSNYVGNTVFYDFNGASVNAAISGGQLSSWVASGYSTQLSSYGTANFELIVPKLATVGPICADPNACATFYFAGIAAYGPNSDRITYATNGVGWDKGAAGVADPADLVTQQTTSQDYSTKSRHRTYTVDLGTGEISLALPADLVTGVGPFPYSLSYRRFYSSSANGISNDNPLGARVRAGTELSMLPIGWTHELAISARLVNDGMASFGRNSALDASQTIVALYLLRQLNLNPGVRTFQSKLASVFTANWLGGGLVGNVVAIKRPPRTNAFVRLPDGTFNPEPGNAEKLVQQCPPASCSATGSRVWNNNNLDYNLWDNSGLSFVLTGTDGSILTFGYGVVPKSPVGASGTPSSGTLFVPSVWAFPERISVKFSYTSPAVSSLEAALCLVKVQNSLGRSLTFTDFCTGPVNPPSTWTASDDSNRTISLAVQPAQSINNNYPNHPFGWNPGDAVAVTTLLVTGPDGSSVSQYDYVPAPVVNIARPYYKLSDWRTAADRNNPFVTFGFDSLYRIASVKDNTSTTCCTNKYFLSGIYGTENQKAANEVDQLGALTTRDTDRWGGVLRVVDPLGRSTSHVYDTFRRNIQDILPEGNGSTYQYDMRHNLTATIRNAKPGSALGTTTISTAYVEGPAVTPCVHAASCNKPYQVTDARNNVTTYTWDPALGVLTNILYPSVPEGTPNTGFGYTTCTYSGADPSIQTAVSLMNTKTQRVWPGPTPPAQNLVTQYNYNPAGKCTLSSVVTDYGGKNLAENFIFDNGGTGPGNVTSIQDANGNATGYVYDSFRRALEIDRPLNSKTLYTYDLDGQRTSVQAWDSTRNAYETEVRGYWPNGDLAYVIGANANPTAPAQGASTTISGSSALPCPGSFVTCYQYDANGRAVLQESPVTATTDRISSTVYDLAGQVICRFQGWNGATPAQVGDCTNWKPTNYAGSGPVRESFADPSGGYSLNGKPLRLTDADGNVSTNVYDGFDRLSQLIMPGAAAGSAAACHVPWSVGDNCELYGYDGNDFQTSKQNRSGRAVSIVPDAMNRERTRIVPNNAQGNYARTVSKTYDLVGRLATASVSGADTQSLNYSYDTAGRLQTAADSVLGSIGYTYDANSNRTQITWPGSAYYVSFAFDALNQLCKVKENATTTCAASDPVSSLVARYTWDSLARRQSIAFGNGLTTSWTYYNNGGINTINHVIGAKSVSLAFSRNQVDQITSQGVAVADSTNAMTPDSFVFTPGSGAAAAYVPTSLNQYSSVAGVLQGYDTNGNLTGDGSYTYQYDEENRLRSASGANSVTYHYDPLGRRQSKTVNGTVTQFLSDDQEEIAEYSGSGTLLRYYINGHSMDEHLAQVEAGGTHYYLAINHQGSVLATSDGAQNVATVNYGPFGESSSANTGVAFRYTGRRLDAETGLYYYRARYYSPVNGRFLQTDPVGFKDDLNLYAYVYNDPLNRTDPSGKSRCTPTGPGSMHCESDGPIDHAILHLWLWWYGWTVKPTANSQSEEASPPSSDDKKGPETQGENSSSDTQKLPNDQLQGPPSKRGNAPIGEDGNPVELHHEGQKPDSPLKELTKTDHRGGDNFKKNHENTGQEPSEIDRRQWNRERRDYWNKEWDAGRFEDLDDDK
jgi:RHS repeat-associated protein